MAITITQDCFDNELTVSNANNVIASSSTNVTNPKFKYVFDIYVDGSLQVRIRRSPNPSGAGIISLREIGRSFCKPTFENNDNAPIDYTPQISTDDLWSINRSTVKYFEVKVGEEYAASPTAAPEIQAGSYVDTSGYVMLGAQQVQNGQIFPVGDFRMNNKNGVNKFLTVVGDVKSNSGGSRRVDRTNYVTNDDWGVVGVMRFNEVTTLDNIGIAYYDSMGTTLSVTTLSLTSTGYIESGSVGPNNEKSAVQYLGVFPENLRILNEGNSNPDAPANNGWESYQIFLRNSEGSRISEYLMFRKMKCAPFQKFRLKFQNNIGGWDYFNFILGHRENFEVDRKEVKKLFGSWSGNTYAYDFWERGKAVSNSVAVESFQVKSDYIEESYSELFKQLINSREVYWITDGKSIPVVLTDSGKRIKKKLDGEVIRYEFTFETAHEIISA